MENLTEKQKIIIEEIYKYQDDAEINDNDKKLLTQMFDTPEKLVLLRKIFRIFTTQEEGLLVSSSMNEIDAETKEKLADEFILHKKVQNKIQNSLIKVYLLVKDTLVEEKVKEFEEEAELERKQEKIEQKQKENEAEFGENL